MTTQVTETIEVPQSIEAARVAMRSWLADNAAKLEQFKASDGDVSVVFARLGNLQRLLFDSGWIRLGWSPAVGGLGGPPILRSIVSEELAAAGYPPPFSFATQEVLGPAVAKFARAELSSEVLPRLLSGAETWCQGFSEPGAGSDLASLRLKATPDGDGFRLRGEKIWTSWAQFADRCIVLARTGTVESAHKGISAFLLDMDTPGIEVSPLKSMNGDEEFCSLYFDDVFVSNERLLGDVGDGWAVAMYVLAGERGAAAWQRQIWMQSRLGELARSKVANIDDKVLGESLELLLALRLLSRRTVRKLSDGEPVGAATSLDKLAMSTAEKFLFDAALIGLSDDVIFGSDSGESPWRNDYLYSRASSIYGGAAEIQRNIIAERLLGLPR